MAEFPLLPSTTHPREVRRITAVEDRKAIPEPFLEPVYLNEKMVLNCAAYIFKGYSLESETNDTTQTERSRGGKAGFNFLERLISIGLEAGSKQSSTTGNRSARRYTVGGLHMSLIDELHHRQMLHAIDPETLGEDLDGTSYVEMLAELRPVDFYALIDTLRMAIPIVEKVLTSIVKPLYDQDRGSQDPNPRLPSRKKGSRSNPAQHRQAEQQNLDKFQLALGETENYATALQGLLEHLENDYRRSKQIEMVMWSAGHTPRPYGVVDLDLADYEPEELRAKLSGGTYHVVGKVTRNVKTEQSINLLQKSVLFSAMSLLNRVVEMQGETDALRQYRQGLSLAKPMLERFGLLEVPGPALRVAAMSVCI
ncbi:MAG: hypothetical protein OXH69_06945 [Acidobacteria bacterium]|nr:hypothetical protein [Acidobacteriota bacterium]